MKHLLPDGWERPKGYSNGISAEGRLVFVAGQVGWNGKYVFETDDFVGQLRQVLINTREVLAVAEAGPEHIVRMTWYFTNKKEYVSRLKEIGAAYREIMGPHYPAMAAVEVCSLVEDRAKIEIETTAVIPKN